MDPEEFEELVTRAGGVFTRKPTGYAIDLKPCEQLRPRTHCWVGIDTLSALPEGCPRSFYDLCGALRISGDELRELLAGIRREERGRIIAAHALI